MKVAVVGLGLIGGSMALDLKASGFASEVLGVDNNPSHQQEALSLGIVDKVTSIEEAAASADLVILAVPMNAMAALLPKTLDAVKEDGTVMDVGSTKARIAELIKDHPKRNQFVLAHPMAGTEFSGPKAALKGLFKGKAAVICDPELSGTDHLNRIMEVYFELRMRPIMMNSKMHDLHAAYVSHLSHISSFVLANTVLDKEKDVNAIFNLASGGFESTVRLAKSSPEMWAPIFDHNLENITEALGAYIEHLQAFHEKLKQHDFEGTKKLMSRANEIRRVLAQIENKGKKNG